MSVSNARSLAVAAVLGASAFLAAPAHAEVIYGLNQFGTNIFTFDTSTPGTIVLAKAITGLTSNEQLQTIDIRPADGKLYGVGSFGNTYRIDPVTGVATSTGNVGGLNGIDFGFDFNPTVDRARLVSEVGTNIRIDPTTGTLTATDTNLAYAVGDANFGAHPNVVDLAYNNNVAGAQSTTLYGIDTGLDRLVTLSNPNSGLLSTVGALGLDVGAVGGFDISPSGVAYAALQPVGSSISNLYTVNLTNGLATLVGQINGGLVVRDIAVAVPEPASLGLLLLAAPALLVRRRKA